MKIKYSILPLVFLVCAILALSLAGCTNESTVTPTTPAATLAVPPATTQAQTSAPATTTTALVSTAPAASITTPAESVTLNISAAASLTDALKAVNSLYTKEKTNVTITPNFASSGTLQKQIEQGAPADVFISAASAQMDTLQKGNLIVNETRQNLLNNKVVLVVPDDSTLALASFKDLTGDSVKKIAIGDPKSVPAGTYAQQAFDLLGITAQLQSKLVIGSDVRGVLAYVESGNVDAGIVYSTDSLISSKVKVVASAPDEINAKIVYPVAVIAATRVKSAAQDYINFLFTPQVKEVFEKYGFSVVSK
jgi:molybdate transport system substrate-binding protein